MLTPHDADFSARIIAWQRRHGRHDLPWQQSRDAYRVWLSEIMLQQTQVGSVIPYYQRFLDRFPDVAALAAAPLEDVLAHWAGLGYYARARNLHAGARRIVGEHGGRFPATSAALATLPGIGRSTAAAIAAFAHGERAAILDGNVKRVLCRCFGIDGFPGRAAVERELWTLAESLLPATGIEAYTQGLMDLGATLCRPRRPDCDGCPLAPRCVARRDGRQPDLPAPRPRRPRPEREATILLLDDGAGFLLEARPAAGLWGGLLAAPEGLDDEPPEQSALRLGYRVRDCRPVPELRHHFTHFVLTLRPLHLRVDAAPQVADAAGLHHVAYAEIGRARLPAPLRRLLGERVAAARQSDECPPAVTAATPSFEKGEGGRSDRRSPPD